MSLESVYQCPKCKQNVRSIAPLRDAVCLQCNGVAHWQPIMQQAAEKMQAAGDPASALSAGITLLKQKGIYADFMRLYGARVMAFMMNQNNAQLVRRDYVKPPFAANNQEEEKGQQNKAAQDAADSITITVTRDASATGAALLGQFVCDGLTGHTLENDKRKIAKGQYRAYFYESPKLKQRGVRDPIVLRLPDEETGKIAIEIHAGNYVRDTDGCILVGCSRGMDQGDGCIFGSKSKFVALKEKCDGKKTITVIIQ